MIDSMQLDKMARSAAGLDSGGNRTSAQDALVHLLYDFGKEVLLADRQSPSFDLRHVSMDDAIAAVTSSKAKTLVKQILVLLDAGQKIAAIKLVRQRRGWGLLESKLYVDRVQAERK